jgi:hypothetical protein
MESYGTINNNQLDLEKLARQFNNNKKTQSNDIYKKYRKNPININNSTINNSTDALRSWIGSQADIGTVLSNNPDNHKISPYYLNASMGSNDVSGLSMVDNINDNTAPINSKIRKKNNKIGTKKEETGFYSAQGEYAELSANNDNLIKINKSNESSDLELDSHADSESNLDSNLESNLDSNLDSDSRYDLKYDSKNDSKNYLRKNLRKKSRKKPSMGFNKKYISGLKSDIILDSPTNYDSMDSISSDISDSSDISESLLTYNTKDIDKHIKSKSKFNNKKHSTRHTCIDFDLNSIDSLESLDSGESLLRHIRFCTECKDKVMGLIRKHKSSVKNKSSAVLNIDKNKKCEHIIDIIESETQHNTPRAEKKIIVSDNTNNNTNNNSNNNTNNNSYISSFRFPELKEIIIVCLLGFLIIIILDLVMKSNK